MKVLFTKWILVFGELLLICIVAFSQTNSSSKHGSDEIANAAFESDRRCESLLAALGKGWPPVGFESGEYEIPPICWTEPIKELKPVKVYDHRLNVAIVLSIRDGVEEGIYICNVVSSYQPLTRFQDGFDFIRQPEAKNVFNFRRTIHSNGKTN